MARGGFWLILFCVLSSAVAVTHTIFASEGSFRRTRVRHDLALVEEDLHRLEGRVAELRARIDALKSRRLVQESVVRRELSYVRPGEIIIDVDLAKRSPL